MFLDGADRNSRALRRRLLEIGQANLNPWDRFRRFFSVTIWEERPDLTRWRRFLYPKLRILTLSVWNFRAHGLPTHASALAYTSLVALVPVLAVAFSLFQVFGGLSSAKDSLMDALVRYLAPGMTDTATEKINEYMIAIRSGARANAVIGTVLILVTVIRTLSTLEGTFNEIVGVKKGRPWSSRIPIYWAVATLGPVLLGASLTMSASVRSSEFVQWLDQRTSVVEYAYRIAPSLLTCAAFSLLYALLPNAPVRKHAALVGGVAAGVAFEVAKLGFTTLAANLLRSYEQVYTSIAAVFVFLVWIYISWTIVLIGLELVVATQSATTHRKEELATQVSEKFREMLALRLTTEVAERFHHGRPPPTIAGISGALDVPDRLLHEVIEVLEDAAILRQAGEPDVEPGYVPARPLEKISVQDVVDAMREAGSTGLSVKVDEETRYLARVVEDANAACTRVCGEETMRRIVEELARGSELRESPAS
ncbi:MAG TPA: YhjD/YihY/BrkB family envelope integrity protein [Planctomycetota bacterium]|nr:YhjD/YihY/BrkB family envelope integrity protein [Planctomycetota bacterium]